MLDLNTRAAHIMAFNSEGRHVSTFTPLDGREWSRDFRASRANAGATGTVLVYAASVCRATGALYSVAASPTVLRAPSATGGEG